MGTENSTTVTIEANSGVNWDGQPSNTITLNKGYSYVLGIDHANSSYDEDIIGTKITADKKYCCQFRNMEWRYSASPKQ